MGVEYRKHGMQDFQNLIRGLHTLDGKAAMHTCNVWMSTPAIQGFQTILLGGPDETPLMTPMHEETAGTPRLDPPQMGH